ncbi:MSCRAMM family protein [Actinokineospora enzanensis]|uniref:MSCRAMM family protein n=1 Tax=Actinokineospora enzanensis TaxID=155975 RepID=UPI00036E17B1|nr:hypothetical protein [Actinokineospora enzanensis]
MRRTTLLARLTTLAAGIATITGSLLLAAGPIAVAAPAQAPNYKEGFGIGVPPQPYKGYKADKPDWLGSYEVNGQLVWCVRFAYWEPSINEQFGAKQELGTKFPGVALDPSAAADISYLLLKYGDTKDPNTSAALAHLLHTWTAPSGTGHDTNPARDFRSVAYDPVFHENALPAPAKKAVNDMRAAAAANRGPWKVVLTKPAKPQIIGTPDKWTVEVRNAANNGVPDVEVKATVQGGTIDGKETGTAKTKSDGSAAELAVTPTRADVSVAVTVKTPADKPVMLPPTKDDVQAVVTTGGEKEVGANAQVTAVTAPGSVAVTKVDEKTGKGIASVSLRLTAADKASPAVDQDGKPLAGADGKPVVLVTDADGKAAVPNLRTPQELCVTEVAAPPGYEQSFDAASPPQACGTLDAGKTLELRVVNKPNVPTVPRTIPAGDGPIDNAAAVLDQDGPSGGLLAALGALLLLAAGVGTTLYRKGRGKQVVGRRMRKDWGH